MKILFLHKRQSRNPVGVAVSPDGGKIYVTNCSDTVSVVEELEGFVTASISMLT